MSLQTELEAPIACPEEYYAEQLLNFVIDGWIEEETARELTKLPYEIRGQLSSQVREVSDTDSACGDQQRAQWATGILGREMLSQAAKTVFIETASLRPERGHKQGLGGRVWTCGRHSSPDTYDW
jgi:hypothetical protein